jgi:hypothetical protein
MYKNTWVSPDAPWYPSQDLTCDRLPGSRIPHSTILSASQARFATKVGESACMISDYDLPTSMAMAVLVCDTPVDVVAGSIVLTCHRLSLYGKRCANHWLAEHKERPCRRKADQVQRELRSSQPPVRRCECETVRKVEGDAYCPRSTETEKPTSSGLISSLERSESGSMEAQERREVALSSGRNREPSGARALIEDRTSTSRNLDISAEPTTTRCSQRRRKLSRKSCITQYREFVHSPPQLLQHVRRG